MRSGPKITSYFFPGKVGSKKVLSPLNKCGQKQAVVVCLHGRTCWLLKTKSADSNWRPHTLRAYWTRSSWTAVLRCALLISAFIALHCVRLTRGSLWGLKVKTESKVKDPELDIIFISSMVDYCCFPALLLYQEYMSGFTETNIMRFFSSACGTTNHRNRQQQALCDLFVSVFSFHICWSYSKPRGSIHSLEIKIPVGINLYLFKRSSLGMHAHWNLLSSGVPDRAVSTTVSHIIIFCNNGSIILNCLQSINL